MSKRNSKTAHIVAALALSAGLFSATNANAAPQPGCIGANAAKPSCSTSFLPIVNGKTVYYGGHAYRRNQLSSATITITNGSNTIITTKKISSAYSGSQLVINGGGKVTARIVADWNAPLSETWGGSRVYVRVATTPISDGTTTTTTANNQPPGDNIKDPGNPAGHTP